MVAQVVSAAYCLQLYFPQIFNDFGSMLGLRGQNQVIHFQLIGWLHLTMIQCDEYNVEQHHNGGKKLCHERRRVIHQICIYGCHIIKDVITGRKDTE